MELYEMITRGMLINQLQQIRVLNANGRISPKFREILSYEPDYIQKLLDYTRNIRYNACLHARLHCLLLGIQDQPYCRCGNVLRMRMTGRYAYTFPTHCSNKCTANNVDVRERRRQSLLKTNISAIGNLGVLDPHSIHSSNDIVRIDNGIVEQTET